MSITLGIIIITAIISFTSFNRPKAIDDLSMWPVMITTKKQYYRFITSGFVHADFMHLLFNMFTLYFFGENLERFSSAGQPLFPPFIFIGFYLAALVASDIPSFIKHRHTYAYRSIGASGAVSALMFATILFDPWGQIGIFGIIPVPSILYAVLYMIYCVYSGRRQNDHINHDAHLWGGLFGWAFTFALYPWLFSYFFTQLMHPHF
jgi:membrane associated rhomboid family serine protease